LNITKKWFIKISTIQIFCLLYLQVRNNQNMSENSKNLKKFKSEARASAKIFPGGKLDTLLILSMLLTINANARSQNALPFLHHNENDPCYAGA